MSEHQQFQQQLIQLQDRVNEKDKQLNHLSQTLQTVHSKLLEVLHETKPVLDSTITSRSRKLDMKDVLSYAHLISGTTSGPSVNDRGLERVHILPYPQPHQWGQSLLYPKNLQAYKTRKQQELLDKEAKAKTEVAERIPFIAFNQTRPATLSSPTAIQSPKKKVIRLFGADSDDEDSDSD